VQKVGQQWYLSGVTSLIRGRKGGLCKNDAIYFNSRLSTALEWIERSLRLLISQRNLTPCGVILMTYMSFIHTRVIYGTHRCSPSSFSCSDGRCIPMDMVCDSVRHCLENGLDENEILCETNRKCDSVRLKSHQCSLAGKCISKHQVAKCMSV
jgi:hypothetical protein